MSQIFHVADLKNCDEVLRRCDNGSPVCFTENGSVKYVVQRIEDYEKLSATVCLLSELN